MRADTCIPNQIPHATTADFLTTLVHLREKSEQNYGAVHGAGHASGATNIKKNGMRTLDSPPLVGRGIRHDGQVIAFVVAEQALNSERLDVTIFTGTDYASLSLP